MLTCVDIANNTGEPVLHKQSCVTQDDGIARLGCILGTLLDLSAGNIMSVSEGEAVLHRRR